VTPAENRPRRGLLATVGVIVLLGLAVGVTAVAGGLRREPDGPMKAGPGRPVDLGLFKVVPLDAQMTAIKQFSGPPKNAVAVRARVTNLGDRSWGITSFLDSVAAKTRSGRFAGADQMDSTGQITGDKTDQIHPRMPIDVRIVWTLPKNTTLRNITVVFRQWSYGQSFTTDEFEWTVGKDSPVAAEITFPVLPGARS
jgi:hypothetical protein